ncbi:MAG: PspA/IM30 family protein, partial [Chloroflexi bacterium]|nr:PspA/IM30 family protein [Chloroflexota bacterium]
MGLLSRIMTLFKAKMSQALDTAESPHELLDYSYEKQLQLLQDVKRGIVEVVTARRRLELQLAKQGDSIAQFDNQARRALAAGREDLARLALERKQVGAAQITDLQRQIGELASEQERLQGAEQRLAMKVESFRTRKEVIKAQY